MNEVFLSGTMIALYAAIFGGTIWVLWLSRFKAFFADSFCALASISAFALPLAIFSYAQPYTFGVFADYGNQLFVLALFGSPLFSFVSVMMRSLTRTETNLLKVSWSLFAVLFLTPVVMWAILVTVRFGDGA